jgi:GxxExxY protein
MIDVRELTHRIIGAAMRVHSHFGPGFLEEVYKNALFVELQNDALSVAKEVAIPVDYRGVRVGDYKADLIVEQRVIVELKAVSSIIPRHEAQLVNYLVATRMDDGLLLNFGAPSLQFKHKYRLPKQFNPVHPVNPVKKELPGEETLDKINKIDRIPDEKWGDNSVQGQTQHTHPIDHGKEILYYGQKDWLGLRKSDLPQQSRYGFS